MGWWQSSKNNSWPTTSRRTIQRWVWLRSSDKHWMISFRIMVRASCCHCFLHPDKLFSHPAACLCMNNPFRLLLHWSFAPKNKTKSTRWIACLQFILFSPFSLSLSSLIFVVGMWNRRVPFNRIYPDMADILFTDSMLQQMHLFLSNLSPLLFV